MRKLIELQGPQRFQNKAQRNLLEGNRVTIALECLIQKKRCFLEHQDRKTIPWAADPEFKTLVFYLHDMLCDVPGLLEDDTNLQHSNLEIDQKMSLHRDLSSKILVQLQTLYELRVLWQQQNPDSCYEVPTSTPDHAAFYPTIFNPFCSQRNLLLQHLSSCYPKTRISSHWSYFRLHIPISSSSGDTWLWSVVSAGPSTRCQDCGYRNL